MVQEICGQRISICNNLPGTLDILRQFYTEIHLYTFLDGRERLTMLEVYLPAEEMEPYFYVGDFPFNFQLIFYDDNVKADDVLDRIETALNNVPVGRKANWVLGNHDQWRIGSRTRPELIDIFNLIALTLPGVSVTYQGEEIGMTNADISYEDTVDPSGCNCGPDRYDEIGCSRDPERTPMQWSSSEINAGFSTANQTWLPVNPNYKYVNVESEKMNNESHWNIFKSILDVRKYDVAFEVGEFKGVQRNNILGFARRFMPFYTTLTLANFNQETMTADLSDLSEDLYTPLVFVSTGGFNQPGDIIDLKSVTSGANKGLLVYLLPSGITI